MTLPTHHDDHHESANNGLVFTVPGAVMGLVAYVAFIAVLVMVFA